MRIFFRRRDFDIFEIFVERIACVVKLFDEFCFILIGIDVKGSTENDHLYLVGLVAGQR